MHATEAGKDRTKGPGLRPLKLREKGFGFLFSFHSGVKINI